MNRPRNWAGAMVLCSLGLAGCTADASTTKAGGDPEPIVLRFGTNDFPGRPAADQIEEFGRQVEAITDGALQIEGVFEVGGFDGRNWDQNVAQRVIDGDLDGANIPARAWDRLGVTSMVALHAPFLVTTTEAMNAVLTDDDLVAEMLAGLDGSGVTGLGIAPERIRHLFAFGDPLVSPGDFDGKVIRTNASTTQYALFESLGAVPDDIPDLQAGIEDGTIDVLETGLPGDTRGTITANLALFPKADVLVVSDEAFDRLSDEHQAALRGAAVATRDWAIAENPDDVDLAADFCEGGGTIVAAGEDDVAAIHELVQPVYDEIEADPAGAAMLDRIREVVAGVEPGPTIEPCETTVASTAPAAQPATFGIHDLDGVYRFEFTEDHAREAGIDERWIEVNRPPGLITAELDGGRIAATWGADPEVGYGTYTISGSEVTFRIDNWNSHWKMRPTLTDEGITWTFLDSLPPWGTERDGLIDAATWTSSLWFRIADLDDEITPVDSSATE